MDGFNEKKWFVYIGDHHEGPFSLEELHPRFGAGVLGSQTYAWCEGMGDWQVVTELAPFAPLVAQLPGSESPASAAPPASRPADEPVIVSRSPSAFHAPAPAPASGPGPSLGVADQGVAGARPLEINAGDVTASGIDLSTGGLARARSAGRSPERAKSNGGNRLISDRMKALAAALLFVIGIAVAAVQGLLDPLLNQPSIAAVTRTVRDFAQPYLIPALDRFPALGDFISPLPSLGQVSPEDIDDLKSAALGSVQETGPKVAIALSRGDLSRPKFFVTSNMPNSTRFDVYVFGNGDTLVGHLDFSGTTQAVVLNRVGESAPVQMADGSALPRGEYFVYVMESGSQEDEAKSVLDPLPVATASLPAGLPVGRRLVARKVYFLGGEKDGSYEQQLAEFHERVKAKATAELEELRMLAAEFESRLSAGKSTFEKLRSRKVSKANRQKWEEFHGLWSEFEARMMEAGAKWTPEALRKDYFYGLAYGEASQAFQSLARFHGVHHSFFNGSIDAGSFDIQLGEATSQAQFAISSFRNSVAAIESAPLSAAGLPARQLVPADAAARPAAPAAPSPEAGQ